ncbi:hypothetical protein KoxyNG13_003280 [Klebsiella pasteurii]
MHLIVSNTLTMTDYSTHYDIFMSSEAGIDLFFPNLSLGHYADLVASKILVTDQPNTDKYDWQL